jgi:hypothetical protein
MLGVMDDGKYFERDTFLSGQGGHCDFGLVKTLSVKSREAIHFLANDIGIPLSTLFQLGGHSRPRYLLVISPEILLILWISLFFFFCPFFCHLFIYLFIYFLIYLLTPYYSCLVLIVSTHRVPDKPDGTPVPVGYTIIQAMLDYITRHYSGHVTMLTGTIVTSLIHQELQLEDDESMRKVVKGVRYEAWRD